MVDHEGHVKEILWHSQQTGEKDAAIFATVEDYLPENAPERLLPHVSPPCDPAACAPPAAGVSPLSALEAVLLATLLGALLAWLASLLMLRRRRQPGTPVHADDPAAPLILADFARFPGRTGPDWPACSPSSYVTKVEAFLRFAGLPYSKQVAYPDAVASPKRQLPYLQRGWQRIGDSHFIVRHLVATGAAPAALLHPPAAADAAAALALGRMCDTDLAAAIVYERWVDDEGWARCRRELLGPYAMLAPVEAVVGRMARKASFTRCMEQGIGRHSDGDRLALVGEELGALAAALGDRPFLFGDSPHEADACLFGVLDQMCASALNPRLTDLVAAHPSLAAYRARIRARYFGPEYDREVAWVDGPAAQAGGTGGEEGAGKAGRPAPVHKKEE